jgi:ribosomal protein S18 acetylase RimI-like enzyme
MQNQLIYRSASNDDKKQLIRLGVSSYGQYDPQLSVESAERMRTNIRNETTWDGILSVAKGFVCETENKIIGMAFIIPSGNPWDIFETAWSYIRMVGVDPDHQGKGIAKVLTAMCIEHAKKNNEKTIALHTSEMMNAARHIYEGLGFKILREIPPRFDKRYWIYTLDL